MYARGWLRLQRDGFAVLAEDAAHGVGNFADRGVGFDGGENRRHQIFS